MFISIEIIVFHFVKQNVLNIEYYINHFNSSFEWNISPTIRKLTKFESNRIFNIKIFWKGNTHWEPSSDFESHQIISPPYTNIQPTLKNVDKNAGDNPSTAQKVPYWEAFDLASSIGKILNRLSTLAENPIDIHHSRFFEEKFGIAVTENKNNSKAGPTPHEYLRNSTSSDEILSSSNNIEMTSPADHSK